MTYLSRDMYLKEWLNEAPKSDFLKKNTNARNNRDIKVCLARIHCITLRHTATHIYLKEGENEAHKHPAGDLNKNEKVTKQQRLSVVIMVPLALIHCNTLRYLQHTATHCNILQHTATNTATHRENEKSTNQQHGKEASVQEEEEKEDVNAVARCVCVREKDRGGERGCASCGKVCV